MPNGSFNHMDHIGISVWRHHNFDSIFMFMLFQLCASLRSPVPNTMFGGLLGGPLISCDTKLGSE